MVRQIPITICLIAAIVQASAQAPVALISPSLTSTANAVVRWDNKTITVRNKGKVSVEHEYYITILNEAADEYGGVDVFYDQLHHIEKIEADLFDHFGRKIRSLKKNEIRDQAVYSSVDLAVDDRVKSHHFRHRSYPYSVRYRILSNHNGTFYLPSWRPVPGAYVSVEKSSFSVETPAGFELRYKGLNLDTPAPALKQSGKSTSYTWKLESFPGLPREHAAPAWYSIAPGVLVGAADFELESYRGKMNDWSEMGLFFKELNRGRDQLPASVKAAVAKIKEESKDRIGLIKGLYGYLQANTRYVSIQFGIGGWQPFAASSVAATGYGDCKALSNYMVALLKEAGIEAYYALIRAGSDVEDIDPGFPFNQFNHVIVCVPGEGDSTWLECTSQTVQPGYLGAFTGNRFALLVTPEGGKLARTPVYTAEQNQQRRAIELEVGENGDTKLRSVTSYTGLQQDYLHGMLKTLSGERVKEFLQERMSLGTYNLTDFHYQQTAALIPEIEEELKLDIKNYASVSGKRLFIVPNILTRFNWKPEATLVRQTPLKLGDPYRHTDTVSIKIPEGYTAELVPPDTELDNKYCTYKVHLKIKDGRIEYSRLLEYKGGGFPAAEYGDFSQQLNTIYKTDRAQVVLVKK